MADIVILGAGLTGLSAAYHLEQLGFNDYVLFEKDLETGGLCRSVVSEGFTFDYTGHLLHINDIYFKSFIEKILDMQNLNMINRRSFVYSQDKYSRYPYQINLFGLPAKTITECIENFVNRPKYKNPKSFYQWVLTNFGKGFADHFFVPYQTKIFDYDVKKLSASWTSRFVPATSLKDLIQGAIVDKSDDLVGYNSQFFYPKASGISYLVDNLAKAINKKILVDHCVTSVDAVNKLVHFSNGLSVKYKKLITTLPLDFLLKNLIESTSTNLSAVHKNLLCNSVINFNLGINKSNVSEKHWIYFPENKYPFYRLGFPHNFSDHMAPSGCSSLYGEISYLNKLTSNRDDLLKSALDSVKQLLNFEQKDIATCKIIDIKHAYVIYNKWRDNNIADILNKLALLDIYSVGRYGEWKYSSMQEAVLDGKKVSETVLR